MTWAAPWQLDRNGLSPTPFHAGSSLLAATPTMLRDTQGIGTAVYWSLTSCHSGLTRFVYLRRECLIDEASDVRFIGDGAHDRLLSLLNRARGPRSLGFVAG